LPDQPSPRPPRPEPREGYIAVGYILGAHGLEGELKVDSLSDNPERFRAGAVFRAGDSSITIRSLRAHRGALLLRIEGIDTRDKAEELRGLLLEIPDSELGPLEQDEYYRFQIIGLEVRDTEGNILGRLEEVLETGANDVYIVRDAESELLVPAIESVVKKVDLAAGTMVVDPLSGMERRPLARRR
jgi:16S rRNA processing protein RimM